MCTKYRIPKLDKGSLQNRSAVKLAVIFFLNYRGSKGRSCCMVVSPSALIAQGEKLNFLYVLVHEI